MQWCHIVSVQQTGGFPGFYAERKIWHGTSRLRSNLEGRSWLHSQCVRHVCASYVCVIYTYVLRHGVMFVIKIMYASHICVMCAMLVYKRILCVRFLRNLHASCLPHASYMHHARVMHDTCMCHACVIRVSFMRFTCVSHKPACMSHKCATHASCMTHARFIYESCVFYVGFMQM